LAEAGRAAVRYEAKLQPYEKTALAHYREQMNVVYDSGPVIYVMSCTFCHGGNGKGEGPDAKYLHVPPEDLSAVRAERPYVMAILDNGVPGSAMPRFAYYDVRQRERIMEHLDKTFGVFAMPSRPSEPISSQMRQKAQQQWNDTCSRCHGQNGQGTKLSAKFRPPPPDLTAYSLTLPRIREVIENGYPGTTMSSYSSLGEEEIAALADHVASLRSAGGTSSQKSSPTSGSRPSH
jgi:mono/diheme cytochrome c family protein